MLNRIGIGYNSTFLVYLCGMKKSRFITVLLLAIFSLVLLVTVETIWTVENYRNMRRQYIEQIESIFREANHQYINDLYSHSGTFSIGNVERLRAIVDEKLRASGLSTPFSVEVLLTAGGNDLSLMSSKAEDLGEQPIIIDTSINIVTLRLKVKDPHQDILSDMIANVVLQVVSIVVLIIAFCYMLSMLFRAKSIDKIRRDLTHNITHELKTPIAAARATTETLRLTPKLANDETSRNEYLDMTLDQLKRMERLIEEILRNSTEEFATATLRLEECSIVDAVASVRTSIELNYALRDVELRVDIESECSVVADRFHLEGALSALLDNAVKYTPNPATIDIKAWTRDGYTYISIEDNGPGIARRQQRHIFDKFYRINSGDRYSSSGYGLGLYYAKGVATRHHGTLSLTSELGRGSCFTLKLPRYGK